MELKPSCLPILKFSLHFNFQQKFYFYGRCDFFWHSTTAVRAVTRQIGKLVAFYACGFYTGLCCISCAVVPEDTSETPTLSNLDPVH